MLVLHLSPCKLTFYTVSIKAAPYKITAVIYQIRLEMRIGLRGYVQQQQQPELFIHDLRIKLQQSFGD